MTNNQNWPDRVWAYKIESKVFPEIGTETRFTISPAQKTDQEYISAEKVREIQLATIVKAFAVVLYELARSGKFGQVSTDEILDSIDPQSIIERVKI